MRRTISSPIALFLNWQSACASGRHRRSEVDFFPRALPYFLHPSSWIAAVDDASQETQALPTLSRLCRMRAVDPSFPRSPTHRSYDEVTSTISKETASFRFRFRQATPLDLLRGVLFNRGQKSPTLLRSLNLTSQNGFERNHFSVKDVSLIFILGNSRTI